MSFKELLNLPSSILPIVLGITTVLTRMISPSYQGLIYFELVFDWLTASCMIAFILYIIYPILAMIEEKIRNSRFTHMYFISGGKTVKTSNRYTLVKRYVLSSIAMFVWMFFQGYFLEKFSITFLVALLIFILLASVFIFRKRLQKKKPPPFETYAVLGYSLAIIFTLILTLNFFSTINPFTESYILNNIAQERYSFSNNNSLNKIISIPTIREITIVHNTCSKERISVPVSCVSTDNFFHYLIDFSDPLILEGTYTLNITIKEHVSTRKIYYLLTPEERPLYIEKYINKVVDLLFEKKPSYRDNTVQNLKTLQILNNLKPIYVSKDVNALKESIKLLENDSNFPKELLIVIGRLIDPMLINDVPQNS